MLRTEAKWKEPEIIRYLKLVAKVADIIIPRITLKVVVDDPADDRILECATAGHADLIVSGDRHLTRLRSFEGIRIVRPVDLHRTFVT